MKFPNLTQTRRSSARFLFSGALLVAGASQVFGSSAASSVVQDLAVQWKGKSHSLSTLETVLPDGQADAVLDQLARYQGWVEESGYHVALSKDARVILVTSSPKASKRRLALVEDTIEAFDELMSPPDRSDLDETFQVAEWGVGDHVPDGEPVMLIELAKEVQYKSLLEGLGEENPKLKSWATSASMNPGFAEEMFSAAAWQAAPDGYEIGQVWRSENELVNRLARLLLSRSYGVQPTWLRIASAWQVEMEVMKSIYCFPYRDEFVGVGDHVGWEREIKNRFKKRKKQPLEFDEFATWTRNSWSDTEAHLSWGFVQFLARHKPKTLPAVAEEFRKRYKAGYKTTFPDGTWRTNPNFEVPLEDQLEVIQAHAGEELLSEASDFFRSWKRYKPKKKRR